MSHDEEQIGALLRLLPPPPRGWVEAARELPRVRALLDEIVARAEGDAEFRVRLVADLESALAAEGFEAPAPAVAELRRRLGAG